MNGKSTVPPLRSSFPLWIKCSVFVQIRAVCAWYQIKNHVHLSTRPIPWNYEEASRAIWAWWEKIKRSKISWTGRIAKYLEYIRLLTLTQIITNYFFGGVIKLLMKRRNYMLSFMFLCYSSCCNNYSWRTVKGMSLAIWIGSYRSRKWRAGVSQKKGTLAGRQ